MSLILKKNKIVPFLWFDNNLEDALDFYTTVFTNSKVSNVSRVGKTTDSPGAITNATFELDGQCFYALNGGPMFKFTEAVSFFVHCENQADVDYYWEKLSEGGVTSRCGWLKDRFGLSWQIIPNTLGELMRDSDREKANRVMQAMLSMSKIDIADLQRAYHGH